ncbi:hypothetical protein AAC387_Pa05g3159 [Persea americana]
MVRFCNDCDKRPEIPIDENNNKKEVVRSKEVKMGGHTQDHDLHCEDHGQCIIFMEGNGMAHDHPLHAMCSLTNKCHTNPTPSSREE